MKEIEVDRIIEKSKQYIGKKVNIRVDKNQGIISFTFEGIGNKIGITENEDEMTYSVTGILSNSEFGKHHVSLYRLLKNFESNQ